MTLKNNIFSKGWIDIVFEGRNHNYGAFVLRKRNPDNTLIALLATVFFFGLVFGLSQLFKAQKEIAQFVPSQPGDDRIIEIIENIIPSGGGATKSENPLPKIAPDDKVPEEQPDTAKENPNPGTSPDTASRGGGGGTGLDTTSKAGGVDTIMTENPNIIVDAPSIMPRFPGGDGPLQDYLNKNIMYPPIAIDNGTEGKIFVSLVIEKDGRVSNVKTVGKYYGDGLEEESIRVVNTLPRWEPGQQNGKPVRVKVVIPIKYSLRNGR